MAATDKIQITHQGEVNKWLKDKPVEFSVVIATRAALRVLPQVAGIYSSKNSTDEELITLVLTSFIGSNVAWLGAKKINIPQSVRNHLIDILTNAIHPISKVASENMRDDSKVENAHYATNACYTIVDAVNASNVGSEITSAKQAINNATYAFAYHEQDIWNSFAVDLQWLEENEVADIHPKRISDTLMGLPLWLESEPDWSSSRWHSLKTKLYEFNEDWNVWTRWYEARLAGEETYPEFSPEENEKLEVARALIADKDWKRGPAHVNALIKLMEDDAKRGKFPALPSIPDEGEGEGEGESKAGTTGLPGGATTPDPPVDTASQATNLSLISDQVDGSIDYLGRSEVALALAGRLNDIWDVMNDAQSAKARSPDKPLRPGFVVHLDAPWGGGKTSFGRFLTQILNPWRIKGALPKWLTDLDLKNPDTWREEFRLPWHIVHFNAWQHHHISPPWWVFYQTIRKQCMTALRDEDNQRTTDEMPPPVEPYRYKEPKDRWVQWLKCWCGEMAWRLSAPKFLLSLKVVGLSIIVLLFSKIFMESGSTSSTVTTWLVALAPLWPVITVLTNTLAPGASGDDKNYSMGADDPLERFRKHFAKSMERFNRPVLVVVDDLDRCEPEFVVELIRGMQTILVSPRVVFLLLGDRDWIEKSFAEVHKVMEGIDVGPEHEFGARFVEKAIQFSFVLPKIRKEDRKTYLRSILKLKDVEAQPSSDDIEPETQQSVDAIEIEVNKAIAEDDFTSREVATSQIMESASFKELPEASRDKLYDETKQKLFKRAVSDKKATEATGHKIEGLWKVLPGNPRQIKRIVNTLTMLHLIAHRYKKPWSFGSPEWEMLARWVVLMTEWPKTWYTLTRHPGLADRVLNLNVEADVDLAEEDVTAFVKKISENDSAMDILEFAEPQLGWHARPITTEEIGWLSDLVPATSGEMLKIKKPEKDKNNAEKKPVGKKT